MDDKFHFGEWLKRQIEDRGITQPAFAEAADLSLQTLRTWLRQSHPNIAGRLRSRLASGLGITRDDLDECLQGHPPKLAA